eukprot:TRINITY_DN35_c0_g2_i5.p1 TRINITY_DN35_c0_g2~~TRINITY_DN35_c0_g2_i5.p1  ORF type:complete len:636 (+),score=86.70 TRINITY_DN35_c0_g2_i5:68-1909(+)
MPLAPMRLQSHAAGAALALCIIMRGLSVRVSDEECVDEDDLLEKIDTIMKRQGQALVRMIKNDIESIKSGAAGKTPRQKKDFELCVQIMDGAKLTSFEKITKSARFDLQKSCEAHQTEIDDLNRDCDHFAKSIRYQSKSARVQWLQDKNTVCALAITAVTPYGDETNVVKFLDDIVLGVSERTADNQSMFGWGGWPNIITTPDFDDSFTEVCGSGKFGITDCGERLKAIKSVMKTAEDLQSQTLSFDRWVTDISAALGVTVDHRAMKRGADDPQETVRSGLAERLAVSMEKRNALLGLDDSKLDAAVKRKGGSPAPAPPQVAPPEFKLVNGCDSASNLGVHLGVKVTDDCKRNKACGLCKKEAYMTEASVGFTAGLWHGSRSSGYAWGLSNVSGNKYTASYQYAVTYCMGWNLPDAGAQIDGSRSISTTFTNPQTKKTSYAFDNFGGLATTNNLGVCLGVCGGFGYNYCNYWDPEHGKKPTDPSSEKPEASWWDDFKSKIDMDITHFEYCGSTWSLGVDPIWAMSADGGFVATFKNLWNSAINLIEQGLTAAAKLIAKKVLTKIGMKSAGKALNQLAHTYGNDWCYTFYQKSPQPESETVTIPDGYCKQVGCS